METLWTVGPEFDDNTKQLEAAGDLGKLSALEELMKTDFDIDLLYKNEDEIKQN